MASLSSRHAPPTLVVLPFFAFFPGRHLLTRAFPPTTRLRAYFKNQAGPRVPLFVDAGTGTIAQRPSEHMDESSFDPSTSPLTGDASHNLRASECTKFPHTKTAGAEARAHEVGSTPAWAFREARKGQYPKSNPRTTIVKLNYVQTFKHAFMY